jgi:hypothetical protein
MMTQCQGKAGVNNMVEAGQMASASAQISAGSARCPPLPRRTGIAQAFLVSVISGHV